MCSTMYHEESAANIRAGMSAFTQRQTYGVRSDEPTSQSRGFVEHQQIKLADSLQTEPASTYPIAAFEIWNRRSVILLLLRSLLTISYSVLIITRVIHFYDLYGYPLSITAFSICIFWDAVAIISIRNKSYDISLKGALSIELSILATFFVLLISAIRISILLFIDSYTHYKYIAHFLLVLIILVSIVFVFNDVRAYPKYWRYKRDCRNIRPLLVFTSAGKPMAILPFRQPTEESLDRLSVDSLQQFLDG
ncbi:hypothetical protein F4782DRAFT_379197 [Xylaria castorea]|nr:hypothetical protein F4782DRAFT_379197 [Xylaria castorea]